MKMKRYLYFNVLVGNQKTVAHPTFDYILHLFTLCLIIIKLNWVGYLFTVVIYRRQNLFQNEMARQLLNNAIAKTRQNYPFTIEAWVLLQEHLHCIWTCSENDNNFSIR